MAEVKLINHAGKQVTLVDFSNVADNGELSSLADAAIELVRSTGSLRSVLGLIDLTGTAIRRRTIASLKRMSRNNGRYMKFVTFVGLNPVWSAVVKSLLRVTKRTNHKVFKGRNEALDWLVSRDGPSSPASGGSK
jgi:hypothetical protein